MELSEAEELSHRGHFHPAHFLPSRNQCLAPSLYPPLPEGLTGL